jgi:hypothetical protein
MAMSIFRSRVPDLDGDYFWEILDFHMFLCRNRQTRIVAYHIQSLLLRSILLGGKVQLQRLYAMANPNQCGWDSLWGAGIVLGLHDCFRSLSEIVTIYLEKELLGEPLTGDSIRRQLVERKLRDQYFRDAISIAAESPKSEIRIKWLLV